MNTKVMIPKSRRKAILAEYHAGTCSVRALAKKHGVSRQTIYEWTKNERRIDKSNPTTHRQPTWRDVYFLRRQLERQTRIAEILREVDISPQSPLRTKLPVLAELSRRDSEKYPINLLCEAFAVSRGAFYGFTRYGKGEDSMFARRRREVEHEVVQTFHGSDRRFGATKITALLRARGVMTCVQTVRSIMRENGLRSIREGAKSAYRHERAHGFPNLVRQRFNPETPNAIWVTDVTEFELKGVKHFICVILDLFARRAIACRISERNSSHLVKMTLREACARRTFTPGLILHSDRGSNLTSYAVAAFLRTQGITPSYSRAHVPQDNAVIECFFKSLKTEELYRRRYRSVREFKTSVFEYIEFYNTKRPHEANGERTPEATENAFFAHAKLMPDNGMSEAASD